MRPFNLFLLSTLFLSSVSLADVISPPPVLIPNAVENLPAPAQEVPTPVEPPKVVEDPLTPQGPDLPAPPKPGIPAAPVAPAPAVVPAVAAAPAVETTVAVPVSPRLVTQLRERYGLPVYDAVPSMAERLKTIKVAILDSGYGDRATLRQDLPEEVFRLVDTYSDAFNKRHNLVTSNGVKPLDNSDNHGRQLGQLVWAMTGLKKTVAPQIILMNANGFTNFRRAIEQAIEEKVDIILYSINWEYGGNFDGRGFINAAVSRATKAGILWVNAAGNQANKVYNNSIALDDSNHVKLVDKGLRVKCRFDRSPVKITLSWNSYADEEDAGTDKDLDLFLLDSKGNVVAKSEKVQFKPDGGKTPQPEGSTLLPREIIETDLAITGKDYYRIKVYAKKRNFTAADKLRITVFGKKAAQFDADEKKLVEPVELVDNQPRQEIMIPGDHPEVITVGDLTPASSRGPTIDGRTKPDILLRFSDSEFTDGEGIAGTSFAAAYFAGILAMYKAYVPHLTREMVLEKVNPTLLSQAYKPGENRGIEDLGVEVVRKKFPEMFTALETLVGDKQNKSPIVLAGKYRKTGQYIVALNTSPLLLGKYFGHFPRATENPAHYEVYVAKVDDNGKPGMWAYVRDRAKGVDTNEAWQKLLEKSPELFVEIGAARQRPKVEKDIKIPLWEPQPLSAWAAKKVK